MRTSCKLQGAQVGLTIGPEKQLSMITKEMKVMKMMRRRGGSNDPRLHLHIQPQVLRGGTNSKISQFTGDTTDKYIMWHSV